MNTQCTKVKICGIRTLDAAVAALEAGADFLGFNFVPNSTRYINPAIAHGIIERVREHISCVGIFKDEDSSHVQNIADCLSLDMVQLHGKENAEYISAITVPVIKSITVYDEPYATTASFILLDRILQGRGPRVNKKKAKELAEEHNLFLAGGLTPSNVASLVRSVRPFAVDVAGGIETSGMEDIRKICSFIHNAKHALV